MNWYSKQKEEFVTSIIHLFDYPYDYSANEIDNIIRRHIDPKLISQPEYYPDHLRIALVELGLLKRTSDGGKYSVSDKHETIKDLNLGERLIVLDLVRNSYNENIICCPSCDNEMSPRELLRHFDKYHSSDIKSYGQRLRKLSALWPYLKKGNI